MSFSYFVSVRAAERITNKRVKKVSQWRNGAILVHFKDGKISVVDPLDFQRDFVDFRQQQGQELLLKRITPTLFACKSAAHEKVYSVVIEEERLRCNCKDWETQLEEGLQRPCCKHCYAVLQKLGCKSLQDFLAMPV
ncbi:MAG: SWIM zinc finger family protein [Limnothrix sp.]